MDDQPVVLHHLDGVRLEAHGLFVEPPGGGGDRVEERLAQLGRDGRPGLVAEHEPPEERGQGRREHVGGQGEELARPRDQRGQVQGRDRAALELDHQVARIAGDGLVAHALPDLLDLGEIGRHADLELLEVVGLDDRDLGEEVDPAGERPQHRLEALRLDELLERRLHLIEDGVELFAGMEEEGDGQDDQGVIDLGHAHAREDAALEDAQAHLPDHVLLAPGDAAGIDLDLHGPVRELLPIVGHLLEGLVPGRAAGGDAADLDHDRAGRGRGAGLEQPGEDERCENLLDHGRSISMK